MFLNACFGDFRMTSKNPLSPARFLVAAILLMMATLACFEATPAQVGESQPKDSVQDVINRAKELLKSRQYEKAADLLRQVVAQQPDSAVANSHLGIAVLRVGNAKEALALAQHAIELDPGYAFSYLVLAEANQAMNRFDEAIEAVRQAIRINPTYFEAYGVLGSLYGQTKRYEESLDAFNHALRLDSRNADVYNGLGIAYYRLGRHEEGIRAVNEAVKLNSNFANAYINLGNWYNELGRYEEAVEAFTNVTRIAPRFPYAYFSRSLLNLYLGRGDLAGDDAKVFLSLGEWSRERAPYMAIIGVLGYLKAGRVDDASRLLELAHRRLNASAWPYPVIAYLRKEISKDALLASATDNDKMTEVRTYIGLMLAITGERQEALKHLKWVKENGNKSFVEFPAALTELRRLEQTEVDHVRQRL
jgi:tetratricopeptide (TPR) repeat protein